MAELYVFIVIYTDNRSDRAIAPTSTRVITLLEEIHKTDNNAELRKLAQRAIYDEDFISLGSCLSKMTNEIYISRVLVAISQIENYVPDSEYDRLFHESLSAMGNRYKYDTIEACLSSGYFEKHPEKLLDAHVVEYTNQLYLFRTLQLLYTLGLTDMAKKHTALLTHKTCRKRLMDSVEEYLINF